MSSSVSVLAPNGRRQTVKCTPNTTVMQIIEEVCRKQGFKSEDYDVKHHNKILDTTISFRFSGLPNNAQLELAAATKTRVDSEVTLAVNLENGDRIMGNFVPDETLWNVLNNLCPDEINPETNPVVIYMRNEIYGSKLQSTTLRSLGLRGGRAMIRLMHKSPDELKNQANVSAPIPAKVVEEKPYHRVLKTEETLLVQAASDETNANPCPIQKKNEVDFLKLAREKRKLNISASKSVENDLVQPKTKAKIEEKVEEMDVDLHESLPEPISSKTKESSQQPQDYREEEFIFLGERNAMLFSLESARSVPSEDLPDDFFELTIDDAKKIFNDIKRKRQESENANLMTSAMRNLEDSKNQLRHLNKYKQSVIRIQFPDRTILQGTFKPIETVQDVCDFARNYLHDATLNFYLYTTPPKAVLSDKSRLLEVGCVPGALLHLGTDEANKTDYYLKAELKDKFTTNSLASLAASKMRKESTRLNSEFQNNDSVEEASMDTVTEQESPGPSTQLTSYERKVIKSTEKVPKWFKTGN